MIPRPIERFRRRLYVGDGTGARSLFFNRVWILFAFVVAFAGVFAGDRGLTLLGLLVLVSALVTTAWNRASLANLNVSRSLSETHVVPGETVVLTITVYNDKPIPVPWITLEEEISEALYPTDRPTTLSGVSRRRTLMLQTRLGPYERVTWRIPLRCPSRGFQTIGPTLIRSGDPLGFFSNRTTIEKIDSLIVFPRVRALFGVEIPPRSLAGETRVSRNLLTDPTRIVGIRDYRPEDPFRSIHWKATARQGTLQVRVTEPTTSLHLAIIANVDTFDHYWEGLDFEISEEVIDLAASLAVWGLERRASVGVFSNGIVTGSDQYLRVPAGRGSSQRLRILEGLAKISAYSSVGFLRVVDTEAARFAPGTTIMIVTSRMPSELLAKITGLIAAGFPTVLVPVGDCPVPAIRGLIVRAFPTPEERSVADFEEAETAHA